jgi:hypothetical protein
MTNLQKIMFVLIVLGMIFLLRSDTAFGGSDCAPIFGNDARAYGNYMNSRESSDAFRVQIYNDWTRGTAGAPSFIQDNARAWERLYNDAYQNSMRYEKYFGPYNQFK